MHAEIVRILVLCPESRNERSREEELHTVFRAGDAARMVKASLLQSGDYTNYRGLNVSAPTVAKLVSVDVDG